MVTVKDLARRYSVTERRIRYLAARGRIPGAVYQDNHWTFPARAKIVTGLPRGRPRKTVPIHVVPPPPLKWAGGKRWLLPILARIWARHQERRLVEPFAGGLAVSLGLRPQRALISDANPHLINFYRRLARGLSLTLKMGNESSLYDAYRKRFNALIRAGKICTKEAAELFYFLNRTGYNGLCRFNRSGEFNVPFGRHKTIRYGEHFADYPDILRSWEFRCGDFESLPVLPEDFIYADPPYDVEFTSYAQEDFRWADQERLAKWLASHQGPVVASNQATPRIIELYRAHRFAVRVVDAPRAISCNGDRSKAKEMIAAKGVSLRGIVD